MSLAIYPEYLSFLPEVVIISNSTIRSEICISGFHNIHYFEFGKEFTHAPEKHDFWEMVYVDKGKIIAITDSIGCILEQGQVIFHEPGEIHAHISNKEVANNMLVVSFTSDSESMRFFRKKSFTLDKTSKTLLSLFMQETKNALGRLPGDYNDLEDQDFSRETFGATQLMQCHLTELLIKLIRGGASQTDRFALNSESRTLAKNSTAAMVIEYLEKNVYSSLTLNELCDAFYIGRSQLSMIFRECTGKSPMQYFADLKIDEAKKLLRENNHSVSEITDLLHYSGIHNFSRAFKNATGFSPTEYKRSIL